MDKVLCIFGKVSISSLKEFLKNHLVALINGPEFKHERVFHYTLESPLFYEHVLKQIAWDFVFSTIEFKAMEKEDAVLCTKMKELLFKLNAGVNLSASIYADFGISIMKNVYANLLSRKEIKMANSFYDKFKDVPAIVIGAGPSFSNEVEFLKKAKDSALLLAGGTAITLLNNHSLTPHFSCAIDPKFPISIPSSPPFLHPMAVNREVMQKSSNPFCFRHQGEIALESWLYDQLNIFKDDFDGGWTVSTVLAEMACLLGCNPIAFIGMDLSYVNGKKYAEIESKEDTSIPRKDWFLAKEWLNDLKKKWSKKTFLNSAEKIPAKNFNLCIESSTPISITRAKKLILEIKASLERCKNDVKNEIAYLYCLEPVWNIWKHVFKREINRDLELQEKIFYKRVINEHLRIINELF